MKRNRKIENQTVIMLFHVLGLQDTPVRLGALNNCSLRRGKIVHPMSICRHLSSSSSPIPLRHCVLSPEISGSSQQQKTLALAALSPGQQSNHSTMEMQGLSAICAGLGTVEEDENGNRVGYSKGQYCLGLVLPLFLSLKLFSVAFFSLAVEKQSTKENQSNAAAY